MFVSSPKKLEKLADALPIPKNENDAEFCGVAVIS
jgi:hypothetical protein